MNQPANDVQPGDRVWVVGGPDHGYVATVLAVELPWLVYLEHLVGAVHAARVRVFVDCPRHEP